MNALLLLAALLFHQVNPAVEPVPSEETRGAAAGWGAGRTWQDQHREINAAVPDGGRVDLVLLGDSITQSWGGPGRKVSSPAAAQREAHFGNYRIANFGISGDRTEHVQWRIDHGNFDDMAPRVVMLLIGTNNLSRGHTPEQVAQGVAAIIDRLERKLPRTQVLLLGVLPRGKSPDDPYREKVSALNERIASLGQRQRTHYLDVESHFLNPDGTADETLYRGDFLHLTSAGYDVWGKAVAPVIDRLMTVRFSTAPLPAASRASIDDQVTRAHLFIDPDWYIWGGSMIQGEDGQYHLFHARWPRDNERAFKGWLYVSEIARATAEKPEGPYEYVETVLKGTGGSEWGAVTAHNPSIRKFDGKYYLYFISTFDGDHMDTDWRDHQFSQRVGVARAEKITGPWKRIERPVCEPGGCLFHYTTNPSVTRMPDGRYLMMLKGLNEEAQWPPVHGVALSDSPTGPFMIHSDPCLPAGLHAEDPDLWYDAHLGRFFAVFKDWHGAHTGTEGGIGLIESSDGLRWRKPAHPLVTLRRLVFDDDGVVPLLHLERPQVYLGPSGEPIMLFCAAARENPFHDGSTFNVHLTAVNR